MLSRTEHRGVCSLLSSVMSGTEAHADRQEDYRFLHSMLMEKKLHLLFKIHERLKRFEKRGPIPARDQASTLVPNLVDELSNYSTVQGEELLSLLCEPHFKSLLWVHDAVAQHQFEPQLPPLPENILEESDDSVKIVSLVKSAEPLGATIRRDCSTGAILVARILKGGAADKSGLIHQGDELREVNGVSLDHKTPQEILPLLASSQREVKLKVIPADVHTEQAANRKHELFVRALLDYDPEKDPCVPCREVALTFRRGDVLQVLSKEDDTWWQARHHGDHDSWAGLIPSEQLHQRRLALQQPQALFPSGCLQPPEDDEVKEDVDYGAISGVRVAGQRRSFRLGRRGGHGTDPRRRRAAGLEGLTRAPAYLEVVPYRRGPNDRPRLVLLVGPPGVGVSELQRRLLVSDPEQYGVTVPYTSRMTRIKEQNGVDYYFVSQRQFEEDILNHRFIEYGMYRGHYYGTSLDSVAEVMAEGKMCLVNLHPAAIKSVYTSEFRPYVVFVRPPRLEELRFTRRRAKFICPPEEGSGQARTFSEEDFEDMIVSAEDMETEHSHMFDKVVVNGDLTTAFRELRAALEQASGPNLQWLPAEWGPAEWVQGSPAEARGSQDHVAGWR
ncbi:MAGUK p55 subfamily member 7-like isoform X1 [Gadus macrocephalus]|uniref:MAGUK p55 subfamily member 7-like isoform X1 n=2 Tax=Gadus macrocephalus TaxID=80720 RepID=UPI0028CB5D84|nr:MAGUK p55 subfamily member 7-like isoform X1 [Gadus macrocephalus]